MSQTIEWLTVKQLRARRAALLERAGMTESELRARRDNYVLDLEGQAVLEALDDVDYLLDGD